MIFFSKTDEYSTSYPEPAGCARVIPDTAGIPHLKVAESVFMDHHTFDWNPYSPFATAEEWRTIALASKQRLGNRTVDD